MRFIYLIIIILSTPFTSKGHQDEGCYPDKGIKKAKITTKFKLSSEKISTKEIKYDKSGNVIRIKTNGDENITNREYKNGKIIRIITKNKLKDFYTEGENPKSKKAVIDTSTVLQYDASGRPTKMTAEDNTTLLIQYEGCNIELHTLLHKSGDTIHQYQLIAKNDVLVETIWMPFAPVKSSRTSKFYDYTFNKQGDWIKRSFHHQDGEVIIEERKLVYY
ncbi:hypothetical protein [uncultured Dokdonia sp.]|uniref:hypothetical protein n=1 Tax=uncultured Dokdonia sp. TaxID=575653 RepID=UPI0026118FAC|nr:hypothetical protein [uncultured Dokdonia sp.]